MRTLNIKLIRELRAHGPILGLVVVIISIGVGGFVGLGTTARLLSRTQKAYYREYRFADFWIDLKKAPLTALDAVRRIDGVASAEERIVFDVIVDVPSEARPMVGRLISVPAGAYERVINGLHMIRGTAFSQDRDEEVILGEAFAREHGLNPGDHVELILNRKRQSFVIVGTAITPEYVYLVRGEGDVLPDPKHFGILFIKDTYARDVLDFRDACNQIVGRIVPGREADTEFILKRIERELDPYGVLAATPRERQASHRSLSDEITQQRVISRVVPSIFLIVAALVLNVLMGRLAQRQRTVIGTLKALGYSDRAVLLHFMEIGLVVGLAGGACGNGVGMLVARGFLGVYRNFFQFPKFDFEVFPDLMLLGLLVSLSFALGGAAKGVWTVLRLHPAEAMRPRPPEIGGAMFLERWPWLWRKLGFRTHMALRGLMRHPFRTASGILSTGLATGIVLTSLTLLTSIWFLVEFQFNRVQHSDVDIALRDARARDALLEARDLPGVTYAEPEFAMTFDARHGRAERRIGIVGLTRGHRLSTPMEGRSRPLVIPAEGVVMASKLAEILDLRVGDHFEITAARGRRQTVETYLAAITESYLGLDCYADLNYLCRLMDEPAAVTAIQLKVDPSQLDELYRSLKDLPVAQTLSVRNDSREIVKRTFVETISKVHSVMIFFAGIIAFGSILNNALVEIGDRTREVSTLRVLGYSARQIAAIFARQSLIVCTLGIMLGFPISYGLVLGVLKNTPTELVRVPIVRDLRILGAGAVLVSLFVLAAQAVVYRQIRRLDWLEGIKVKE